MNEPTPPRVFHTVANIGNIAFVSTPPSHFFLPFPLPASLRPASELLFQAFPNFFGNNNSGGSPALGIGLGERVEAAKRCATRRAVLFFPSSLRFLPFCSLSRSLFPSRGIKFDTDLADLASFVPRPKTDSTRIQVGYLTNDIFEEFGDLGKRVSRFISTTIILPARGPPLLKKCAVFLEKMTEFKEEESIFWLHLREGGEGVRSMASTDSKCVCVRVVEYLELLASKGVNNWV